MKIADLLLVSWLACGVARGAEVGDYLRWRLLGQERTPDGGSALTFALESPPDRLPWESLEVVYRVFAFQRPGSSGAPGVPAPPEIYRKKAAPDETKIVLYSGRPARIELNARAEKGGQAYYARTLVHAFGESGRGDPESERLETAPSWPGFDLVASGGRYLRAQADGEVILRTGQKPARVEVFDDGSLAATLPANDEGRYGYTPSLDPKIQKTWRSFKSLVFAAELPDARTRFSFHLPVYRAYYGRIDYRGGLAALAASALAALAWVGWRGRKFRWR
ncbi:MAG: hypothetical protein LBI87_01045 [Candidatus Accumulibacter sp.]|jgi:hypothetical protein|nr:hypothetical protein [Accumulibacter sp.]